MPHSVPPFPRRALGVLLTAAALTGCGRSDSTADAAAPATPKEAAVQVEAAFEPAPEEVRHVASEAAQAMRAAEYERAVAALTALRTRENLTLDQGLSVHQSTVALEAQLIRQMEAGDPKARQAYEALKRLKKN